MSWTKIDDGILTHPKMADAEEMCPVYAWVLWTKALVYVNQHRLDGRVTRKVASRLVGTKHADAAINALVTTGLWEVIDDGFVFHDFDAHNDTKERRAEKAKKNADAQAAHRERVREEKEAAAMARAASDTPGSKRGVSAYEKERNPAPVPSRPVPSSPVPSSPSSDGGEETAVDDDPDPTEAELFRAYSAGVNQASALTLTHARGEDNAFALSSVRGTHEPNMPKAEFLVWLVAQARAYVADAIARGQERRYEKNYAPTKFLAWLEARKAGVDPFPLAPVAIGGGARRGSQGSPAQSPPRADLRLLPDEPEIVPAPLDDPARLACLRALSGIGGAG